MASVLIRQIPNTLSILRIFLATGFPFVISELRLPFIIVALLSEFLDGYLARRLNAVTWMGQLLDPIADKLFILSVIVVLITEQHMTFLQLSLVAMRDIVVTIGTIIVVLYDRDRSIPLLQPRIFGKLATGFQFALLTSYFSFPKLVIPVLITTATLSCVSAIDYLYLVLNRRFDQPHRPLNPS